MIYKTLHWYVLKELLRVFLMTASALTTLMAFGGTFRQVAKGVDAVLLLQIIANIMPAMLAYAIPIAALFSAVLVFWRLSTDNELTACRASGVSFWSILTPALILGLIVASIDLVFVNFVVPTFLQKTERLIRRDLGAVLVSSIGRQELFTDPSKRLALFANDAVMLPSPDPDVAVVELRGMVGAKLKTDGSPQMLGSALKATVTLRDMPSTDETQITVKIDGGAVYDPVKFQVARGDFGAFFPEDRPYIFPSQMKNKPKFANLLQLRKLSDEPWKYAPVHEQLTRLRLLLRHQNICDQLASRARAQQRLSFVDIGGSEVVIVPPVVELTPDRVLQLRGKNGAPVKVDVCLPNSRRIERSYTTQAADITVTSDEFSPVAVTLNMRGEVYMEDRIDKIPPKKLTGLKIEEKKEFVESIENLTLSRDIDVLEIKVGNTPADFQRDWSKAMADAAATESRPVRALARQTGDTLRELDHTISSELHSRGSFAVSCLTLVLFGAALGVMLKGRNPLAVFVVGFLPSVLLVLLITMGRRVMESAHGNQGFGLVLLWAGNIVLLILVSITYSKLMRA